jgi:hypothetical protein
MKTKSPIANGCSRSFTRRASIIGMTLVAASALAVSHPAFAGVDAQSSANFVTVQQDAPLVEQDYPSVPNFGEDVNPPSYESDLGPPPSVEPTNPIEPTYPEMGTGPTYGGYTSESPTQGPWMVPPGSRFAQPFNPAPATGFSTLPPVGATHAFSGTPYYGRTR